MNPTPNSTLTTNLIGRLFNTSLPRTKSLHPVFESVSNSIHAIEDAKLEMDKGHITIEIVRDRRQGMLGLEGDDDPGHAPISAFKVSDNGIGFTEANMDSFLTLDSRYKVARGGRGVGRLLWLKAFKNVSVESYFRDDAGKLKHRTFLFNAEGGVHSQSIEDAHSGNVGTSIELSDFYEQYRKNARQKTVAIANHLLSHCLWYFVRQGGAPHIEVVDADGSSVSLHDIFRERRIQSSHNERVTIGDVNFDLLHMKLHGSSGLDHSIAFCASNRLVTEENVGKGKIPGLYGKKLQDEAGSFVYQCYVSSSFLDEQVRPERTGFDIEEESFPIFSDSGPSMSDIREKVLEKAKEFLNDYLLETLEAGRQRIHDFVTQKSPRYHSIISRIEEDKLCIDPNWDDKNIELFLHGHFFDFERELISEGHELLKPNDNETLPMYEQRIQDYMKKASDMKGSDLANYVMHRKTIIDLLGKALEKTSDKTYQKESFIHNLIMPMRYESTDIHPDNCNLWLIDERLAFHDFLASDRTLRSMPITSSDDQERPDIAALQIYDNRFLMAEGKGNQYASLSIIEVKRPMRDYYGPGNNDDPIDQVVNYLSRIRKGQVQTASGRPIYNSDVIPGFCYVICDLTPSIIELCENKDATKTGDGLGYIMYQRNLKAYIAIMSFEQVLKVAQERNKSFFDKLGLPTT